MPRETLAWYLDDDDNPVTNDLEPIAAELVVVVLDGTVSDNTSPYDERIVSDLNGEPLGNLVDVATACLELGWIDAHYATMEPAYLSIGEGILWSSLPSIGDSYERYQMERNIKDFIAVMDIVDEKTAARYILGGMDEASIRRAVAEQIDSNLMSSALTAN